MCHEIGPELHFDSHLVNFSSGMTCTSFFVVCFRTDEKNALGFKVEEIQGALHQSEGHVTALKVSCCVSFNKDEQGSLQQIDLA